jgi:hypothetical protein
MKAHLQATLNVIMSMKCISHSQFSIHTLKVCNYTQQSFDTAFKTRNHVAVVIKLFDINEEPFKCNHVMLIMWMNKDIHGGIHIMCKNVTGKYYDVYI